MLPANARRASAPNFDHLDFNDRSCQKWAEYITEPAQRLADVLWNSGRWEHRGQCLVCEVNFPSNLASHLWGRSHCKSLRTRLGWRPPISLAELESHTQHWRMDGPQPCYYFNHVTGAQGYCRLPQHHAEATRAASDSGAAVAPTLASASSAIARDGYAQALHDKASWRSFMDTPAKTLEDFLFKSTKQWDFSCLVCGKGMARGWHDHITSCSHWASLWKRLSDGRDIPGSARAAEWSEKWVQHFKVPRGTYLFNHITGDQMLQAETRCAGETNAPSAPALALPVVQPSESENGTPTNGVPATSHAAPLVATNAGPLAMMNDQPQPPVRCGVDYQRALNSKQDWKVYMEEPAQQLERTMSLVLPSVSNGLCIVCQAPKNSIQTHITSQKHWKKVWAKIETVPTPQDAMKWDKPWVETFHTSNGVYLFNHVTGALHLQDAAIALPANEATLQGFATPPATLAVASSSTPSPSSVVSPCTGRSSQPGPLDIDVWVWQMMIDRPAAELQHALAEHGCGFVGLPHVICNVCECEMVDVVEHLRSSDHYGNLRMRMNYNAPLREQLLFGPWVQQVFQTSDGVTIPVSFNHLTGEVCQPPPSPGAQHGSRVEHEC